MSNLQDKEVGDQVYLDCYTSMGASSAGNIPIIDILYKYDPDTGIKFKVLVSDEGDRWDSRTGDSYDNSHCMYYIS
jgi:hypothetical protein